MECLLPLHEARVGEVMKMIPRLLHESLKAKVKELGSLTVFNQMEKRFHSKRTLESNVKAYMQELTKMKDILTLEEVDTFFKHNAFDIRWNEM